MTQQITYMQARELAEVPGVPFKYAQIYLMANDWAFPHWRPAGAKQNGIKFPKEIVLKWLAGEKIGDHWLQGRLATDLPPSKEAVEAIKAKRAA